MSELLLIGGSGGSGTRAVVRFLQQLGCYAGSELNESLDSMPVARLLDTWVDRWLGRKTDQVSELVAEFSEDYAQALSDHLVGCDSAICVVKNPRAMLLLDLLYAVRPDIKFLHLVRNGASMAFSSNQRQFDLHGHFWPQLAGSREQAVLEFWATTNMAASDVGRHHPGQYAWLQYEAFCTSPLSQVLQACDQLGLDMDWSRADESLVSASGREQQQHDAINRLELKSVRPALQRYGYPC